MINVNEVHPDKDYQGMPENMFTNLENPKIQVFSIEPSFVYIMYIYIYMYVYVYYIYIYICILYIYDIYIAMHEKPMTC